jgi:hypothetical protein
MKTLTLLALGVSAALLAGYSANSQGTNEIRGTVRITNAPLKEALDFYQEMCGESEVIISSNVYGPARTITIHAEDVPLEVAHKAFEKAFLEQAGIVITHLDDKRISVTYNDKLVLKP